MKGGRRDHGGSGLIIRVLRSALFRGPPGGEGAALQPGHQPDVSAAGGQRPGGPGHHPVCQVCTPALWFP